MKALVLAGGSGTRLRPTTYTSAKQLVPLANTPILFFGLRALAEAGVREVGVVVGDTHAAIEEAVGDGSAFGLQVEYIRQDAPRGLAHAVLIARDFLGDEPFVMYLGDNLVVGGITDFVRSFEREAPHAQVLLTKVPDPTRFGVAELDERGHLVRLVEKPAAPRSDLALVGVYLFGPAVHEAVRAIEPSGRGELEITDAIQWLIDRGDDVRSHLLTTPWIDTGKLQDLLQANRIVLESIGGRVSGEVDADSTLEGVVVVEPGARVVRSQVRGPVVIGRDALVQDSLVGAHSSIGDRCRVVASEIEHCVLLDGATIDGVGRIVDSLVGRNARVTRARRGSGALRMHLGDDSDVEVG